MTDDTPGLFKNSSGLSDITIQREPQLLQEPMTLKDTPDLIPSSANDESVRSSNEKTSPSNPKLPGPDDEKLDFVVTEAHGQDPELVSGFKTSEAEELGIETPADLMETEASTRREQIDRPLVGHDFEVDQPPPPMPPEPDDTVNNAARVEPQAAPQKPTEPYGGLEHLSDEQVQEISRRMRAEAARVDYLSDDEKHRLMSAIGSGSPAEVLSSGDSPTQARGTGFNNEPITPPKRSKDSKPVQPDFEFGSDGPKIAKRTRGVAYYAKGYIQVTGQQELHDGDELVISGREYILRKKKLSSKVIAGIIASLAGIVVFVLGALFSSSADIGDGRVIGIVLDQSGRPVLTGGTVSFPELGRSYDLNGQGLFKTDRLDAGSYKLEFVVDQRILGADYATVADDNITTVTLKSSSAQPNAKTEPVNPQVPSRLNPAPPSGGNRPDETADRPSTGTTNTARPAGADTYAKLTLTADVDNAKLSIDGSIVGAGNLTYTKLKPGLHNYTVAKEGYQSANGIVDLKAGRTTDLEISLKPNVTQQKPQQSAEKDFYQSALSAADRGDLQKAVEDLNQAVTLKPDYSDAYVKRGTFYQRLNNNGAAHDDYLRAAEIYQVQKDYGQALSAFESALRANPKSVPAYLGRGSLYLARNEAIAAIADFDMVTRLDKRNLDGYIGLGRARYSQGNYDKATKHFKDARSLEPNNPTVHQYLMLSQFGMGEFKEVQKDYEKFLKCASDVQIQQMRADPKFAPVLRVIEN